MQRHFLWSTTVSRLTDNELLCLGTGGTNTNSAAPHNTAPHEVHPKYRLLAYRFENKMAPPRNFAVPKRKLGGQDTCRFGATTERFGPRWLTARGEEGLSHPNLFWLEDHSHQFQVTLMICCCLEKKDQCQIPSKDVQVTNPSPTHKSAESSKRTQMPMVQWWLHWKPRAEKIKGDLRTAISKLLLAA